MKILTVIGARPQFIKAGALSREFLKHPEIEEIILHTGQHFDVNMSAVFFEEMQIPVPKYHFDAHSLGHGAMTGKMLADIEKVLLEEKPDYLLVYGDTNSTLAGALAAAKLHIKVIHVEAGLRSFNMRMPEEVNRILTDRISNILFCPTNIAVNNLKQEGFDNFGVQVVQCGDVMQDAAMFYSNISAHHATILEHLSMEGKPYILCTLHRAENTDDPARLTEIIEALNEIHKETEVIVPLHPRTQKVLSGLQAKPQFRIIDPVGYFHMIQLLKNCKLVITDSGGLQKEAYFFQKLCITVRDQTEWLELVEQGVNRLTGNDKERIVSAYREMKEKKFSADPGLYGGGHACRAICEFLLKTA
jgi:UDP-GlcNAc3NAcA epimerase